MTIVSGAVVGTCTDDEAPVVTVVEPLELDEGNVTVPRDAAICCCFLTAAAAAKIASLVAVAAAKIVKFTDYTPS